MCRVYGIEESSGESPSGESDEHAGVGCDEDRASPEFIDKSGTGEGRYEVKDLRVPCQ